MSYGWHTLVKRLWSVWLSLYVGLILFCFARNIIPCTFLGLERTNIYLLDIIFTMQKALIWLSPTLFLYAALQLSRPDQKAS